MSDPPSAPSFVREALTDLGASVSGTGSLLWVQAPESLCARLEVPPTFAITFDPERSGEFDAELVAPGSYFLERLVALSGGRGRWDAVRCVPGPDWMSTALSVAGLGPPMGVRWHVEAEEDGTIFLFSFRVTLTSDEKRETFHRIVVSPSTESAWEADDAPADSDLVPVSLAEAPGNLEAAYRMGAQALRERCRESVDEFRAASLRRLEEEVRRIFGYFDRTKEEVQEADPEGSGELVRAIEGERSRRLAETLERFDPIARASLCSVRVVMVRIARVHLMFPSGAVADVTVDAWSHRVQGLACAECAGTAGPWAPEEGGLRCARCAPMRDGSARPQARPRSDIPRRGKRAAPRTARSPRGSRARLRDASGSRPDP
jgi:hypothetical protein